MPTRREFLKTGAAFGATLGATLGGVALLGGCGAPGPRAGGGAAAGPGPDLILHGGRIATMDECGSVAQAIAIRNGVFTAVGSDEEIIALARRDTPAIDLAKKTVIPGLNDSHTHVIRGGLHYNLELRWEDVRSLSDALAMLREQALRTPPPQWVRVVGGWSEFQFAEKRLPTLEELNHAAPETPVFILHLYAGALLNRAALRALGYDRKPPEFPGGFVERDTRGNPTGLLLARPSAMILYKTLSMGPVLPPEDQAISTRHFLRELNRLGVTSANDAGGGGQSYPDDYGVITKLSRDGELTLRLAYNLFAQNAGSELDDYRRWVGMITPGSGDEMLRLAGAGENLTWSAADFENFREARPNLREGMETELGKIVRLLAGNRWPFRIHATYDQSISRFLTVFEEVHRAVPLDRLRWFIDHAETISDRNLARVRALGGGIAIQHRMAFQGEAFIARYGAGAADNTPPVRRMLEFGIPVGAGTDATRVASYNPWMCLYWLVSGRTIGGTVLSGGANRLERSEALKLWTTGSSWFSSESGKKGAIAPGQLADLAVLSKDYFTVPEEQIRSIRSDLTLLGGRIVHAAGDYARFDPPALPVSPDWSPVGRFGGASERAGAAPAAAAGAALCHATTHFGSPSPWTPSHPFDPGCSCAGF